MWRYFKHLFGHFYITACEEKSCLTCSISLQGQSFTGEEYNSLNCDRRACQSLHLSMYLIRVIHCVHCGLVYLSDTEKVITIKYDGH